MSKTDLNCPPNTEATTRGWSKAGYMRYCEPKRNGVWEAWSEGYRHVLGEYKNGIKHGKWKSFDKNGTIKTITTYENGKEIDIKEVNK